MRMLGAALLLALGCAESRTPEDAAGGGADVLARPDATCACASDADCDDGLFCNGEEICEACDCFAPRRPVCGMEGVCDETSRMCRRACTVDADGDRACADEDCDDADPMRAPGRTELCDGDDEDCDGMIDEGLAAAYYVDLDRDGFGDPSVPSILACEPSPGRVTIGGDCDDADASRHPTAVETCDGSDQDCDAIVDEGTPEIAYFPDADGDGYGDASAGAAVFACMPPPGTSTNDDDCDDARADVSPGAVEICDGAGIDEDCDGLGDEGCP